MFKEFDSKMYVGPTVRCSHCVDPRLVQNLLDRFSNNFPKTCIFGRNRCTKSYLEKLYYLPAVVAKILNIFIIRSVYFVNWAVGSVCGPNIKI